MTPPTCSARPAANAVRRSPVNTPACRPYAESLTAANPASSDGTGASTSTGPNTSSAHTLASGGTPVRTVGASVAPSRTPPVSTLAPAATASPIHDSTRSAAASLIIGPTSVASSDGSPVRSASTAATTRSTMASYRASCTNTRCTAMQLCPPW